MSDPFPLPMTSLERFFWLDDLPSYPNHVICRIRFTGRLDRKRFLQAVREMRLRFGMAIAKVKTIRGRFVWVLPEGAAPDVVWTTATEDDRGFPPLHDLDLEDGTTMRIIVVQRPAETDVILQGHHAAVDGVGGMQAVQDMMRLYAAKFSTDADPDRVVHRLDPMRLAKRNEHFRSWWDALRSLPKQSIGLYGAIKYWSKRAVTFGRLREEPPTEPRTYIPQVVAHELTCEESAYLRRFAQQRNVTVNDVMLRDLLLTLRAWQDKRGIKRHRRVFRIMIPVNLRTISDRRMAPANRVSMVYLDRNDQQLERPGELLWGINFEMQTILRFNLSLVFLAMVRLMSMIPGLVKRQVASRNCQSTCIVTNLGEPFARSRFPLDEQGRAIIGDVKLEGFDALAPLRPLTAAAFSIYRYRKRTGITMHYDPHFLQQAEAERFLGHYVNRVQHSARRGERFDRAKNTDN